MNLLKFNPNSYPGTQTITVPNVAKSSEHKQLTIVGAVGLGGSLEVYTNYIDDTGKTRYRLLAADTNLSQGLTTTIPQADTYIFKGVNFNGHVLIDLGAAQVIESEASGDVTGINPTYSPMQIVPVGSIPSVLGTPQWVDAGTAFLGQAETLMVSIYLGSSTSPMVLSFQEADDDSGTNAQALVVTKHPGSSLDPNTFTEADSGYAYGSFVRTKPYVKIDYTNAAEAGGEISALILRNPLV